jgi:hypothetical protein
LDSNFTDSSCYNYLDECEKEENMTYRGHVENGTVVVDGSARLPEGAKVEIAVIQTSHDTLNGKPIWMVALEMGTSVPINEWEKMPVDASKNLDHYLYGASKRSE